METISNLNSISVVENETGISKDTLRMWERRYRYPAPSRDDNGDRIYLQNDIIKLKLIKKLLTLGFRPGRIINLSNDKLDNLITQNKSSYENELKNFDPILRLIKAHHSTLLKDHLNQILTGNGLKSFIFDTIIPLNDVVNDAVKRNYLEAFEKHFFYEILKSTLNKFSSNLNTIDNPYKVLLVAPFVNQNEIDLTIIDTILSMERFDILPLGSNISVDTIIQAGQVTKFKQIIIVFDDSHQKSLINECLTELENSFKNINVFGLAVSEASSQKNVNFIKDYDDLLKTVNFWQEELSII